MDIDLDPDDLDIDLDPLNALFHHKLDQAKILKSEMQSTLTTLNKLLLNLQTDCCNISEDIEICDNWKGFNNGKFVMLIKLENKLQSPLNDINVILNWKPAISPLYELKIYDVRSKLFTKEIDKLAIAILLIEKPFFTKYASYEAQGTLVYKSEKANFQRQLPKISMNIKDDALEIKNKNLFTGNFNIILAVVSSLINIKLILQLPVTTKRKLENYFVIDCMLREIIFDGEKYYVFDQISNIIDGSLMKYKEENNLYVLEVYYSEDKFSIFAGSNKFAHGDEYKPKKFYIHPQYSKLKQNDIALIKLNTPIANNKVKKIKLNSEELPLNTDARIIGWGTTSAMAHSIPKLRYVNVVTRKCQSRTFSIFTALFGGTQEENPNIICTSTSEGRGACTGDSGGPLIVGQKQIGIVSRGEPCATGHPDIFTNVLSYVDWITSTMKNN